MYALPNKTQHKLVVKVRGGISQKLDNFTSTLNEAGFNTELNGQSHSQPQPIFHSVNQNGSKQKSMLHQRAQKQYITPEHNEMIKYVQQSWKGVERDYKKSVNNFINNIDMNSTPSSTVSHLEQKQAAKKKTASTTSTPLLLIGSYHHTSNSGQNSGSTRQDSFQPFDLEAFWGNRILKRLTEEM